MRYLDAADAATETHCDVYPMNLSRERAEDLRARHANHSMWECHVRSATVQYLMQTNPDVTRRRREIQGKVTRSRGTRR